MPRPALSAVLAALISFQSTGCATWHVESEPATAVSAHPEALFRVKLPGGESVVLRDLTVGGDSVTGWVVGHPSASSGLPVGTSVSFRLSEVTRLERTKADFGASFIIGMALVVPGLFVYALVADGTWETTHWSP